MTTRTTLTRTILIAGLSLGPALQPQTAAAFGFDNLWDGVTDVARETTRITEDVVRGTVETTGEVVRGAADITEEVARETTRITGEVVRGTVEVTEEIATNVVAGGGEAVEAIGDGAEVFARGTVEAAGDVLEGAAALTEEAIGAMEHLVGTGGEVARAAAVEAERIGEIARDIHDALPGGRMATELAAAIAQEDAAEVQRILLDHEPLRPFYDVLLDMGFNTIAVGIESSGAFVLGAGHETGVAMDLAMDAQPRLYTTTSAAGGYYFGGGNDLVFTFLRADTDGLDGHAVGSVAEFDVGSGAGMNMWFVAHPFDFAGFSLGVGVGSLGGGGALTYAYTRSWL